jgi:outer membrane murein-binding lipoprotein Lpp
MKKHIIAAAAILSSAMLLAGCGSTEKVITKTTAETTAGTENTTGTEDVTADAQDNTEKGYVFTVNNMEIAIQAEAETYISQLGEPVSYYEAASCAFGDLDKMYTYSGFELDTYSENGQDYVSAVILKDDSVSTTEGLTIGDSVEKVKELYTDVADESDSALVYHKGNMKLCIFIEDDAVVSIEYLNTVLD